MDKNEIYFSNETGENYKFEKEYQNIFNFVLKHLAKNKSQHIVSLTLVDEKTSKDINQKFRGKDYIADVISFAYLDEGNEEDLDFVDLGEIVLCPEEIKKRAKEIGNEFDKEIRYLFIHGILHLLGYDHENGEEEANKMYKLQDELFDLLEEENMIDKEALKSEAKKARELSYSPYSHFKVGAALLTKDGKYIYGANIENSAYSLCLCAERNAIFGAYMQGYKKEDIIALGLITDSPKIASPCGSCRQVMSELLSHDVPVYMFTLNGEELVKTVEELLPYSFDSDNLNK